MKNFVFGFVAIATLAFTAPAMAVDECNTADLTNVSCRYELTLAVLPGEELTSFAITANSLSAFGAGWISNSGGLSTLSWTDPALSTSPPPSTTSFFSTTTTLVGGGPLKYVEWQGPLGGVPDPFVPATPVQSGTYTLVYEYTGGGLRTPGTGVFAIDIALVPTLALVPVSPVMELGTGTLLLAGLAGLFFVTNQRLSGLQKKKKSLWSFCH